MDNMLNYGHKFEANYKAGRRDTALAVAAFVFENLDSAITKQKNSDDIRGKQLLIYTDGLNEAENVRQELGITRQQSALGTDGRHPGSRLPSSDRHAEGGRGGAPRRSRTKRRPHLDVP